MNVRSAALLATLLVSTSTLAKAQAPAGSTGQCKDGTYSTSASKSGACRGHQGVQTWYATSAPAATPAKSAPAAAPTKSAPAAKPAAPAPAAASSGPTPSGANGQCNDGTYSTAASKAGACRGHQGVKTWFSASASPAAAPQPSPKPMPAPAPAPASRPAPAPAPAAAPTQPARSQPTPTTQAAPGGGNGQVWVNTESKVYHCSGDRYYGKTKKGAYMTQADAQAKGNRPDAGKPCPN